VLVALASYMGIEGENVRAKMARGAAFDRADRVSDLVDRGRARNGSIVAGSDVLSDASGDFTQLKALRCAEASAVSMRFGLFDQDKGSSAANLPASSATRGGRGSASDTPPVESSMGIGHENFANKGEVRL
jgi:hypothetical protein